MLKKSKLKWKEDMLNSEMIWKMQKKEKWNSDKKWKIRKRDKSNSEMCGKYGRKASRIVIRYGQ